jgi:hypothetical protein
MKKHKKIRRRRSPVSASPKRAVKLRHGALLGIASIALSAGIASAQNLGPSTSVEPYLLPTHADAETTSILTVNDLPTPAGYYMVGIPDGLGALRDRGGYFKLLMNHELGADKGIVRDPNTVFGAGHGSKGAFVSQWLIDRDTFEVVAGEDHNYDPSYVFTFDRTANTWRQGTTTWDRFCSADLADVGAFLFRGKGSNDDQEDDNQDEGENDANVLEIDPALYQARAAAKARRAAGSGNTYGTDNRIYLNGEETSQAGRAFAHIATGPFEGESWELPHLGRMAFENVIASPYPQKKTVVMLMDDANVNPKAPAEEFPSDLYIYVGEKQQDGHPIEKAGLTNGKFYGIKVFGINDTPITEESNEHGLGADAFLSSARFELVPLGVDGDVSQLSPLEIQMDSIENNVIRLQRIEDGAWDPRKRFHNDFYFVTTASFDTNSRLWRLRFDDLEDPEKGGKIEILLKGDEGQKMLDNVTLDKHGRLLMQEDPGGNDRLAKVWLYNVETDKLVEIAQHNPKFFDPANSAQPSFLTTNEESSGIIDAEKILGRGWFLLDVQAHKEIAAPDAKGLVEHGQLLAMFVDPSVENNDGIIRHFDKTPPKSKNSTPQEPETSTPPAAQ